MTRIFLSHSSKDKKIAMRLYTWLNDFKLIENTWVDIRELKPGMKLENSIFDAIDISDIVIVLVSKSSKKSIWVKKEIEYSLKLKLQEKKEIIVIPILYKIKPDQIPIDNIYKDLLKYIYVTIDEYLFNINDIISSLINSYELIEIPFNDNFNIDFTQFINNLKNLSDATKNIFILTDHKKVDKEIVETFIESSKLEDSSDIIQNINVLRDNFLSVFWLNTSFILSEYIRQCNLKRISYETIGKSIYNIFQELLHRLFLYCFDKISLTIPLNNKNKRIKEKIIDSKNYVFSKGKFEGYTYFISKLYYNSNINPRELIRFKFYGPRVKSQGAYVAAYRYKSTMSYLPAYPTNEIFESDWYEIIIPQFISDEILRKSRELETFNNNELKDIGLCVNDYTKLTGICFKEEDL